MTRRISSAFALILLASCAGDRPAGIQQTPSGNGPMVVWNLDALPFPELPFPNDLATIVNPNSPTKRRINIGYQGAKTNKERDIREKTNRLEGFSTFGTISVRFDSLLDLGNIIKRHHSNTFTHDDVILLVNIDPKSKSFGELVTLDLGHGNFPEVVADPNMYWDRDTRASVQNLFFDTTNEDTNNDGILQEEEDTDQDGYLDVPNVHPAGGNPLDDLLTFYEKVTNTLFARPILPLEQETRYAVVLTKNLVGENGDPVRSPWAYVNHTRQTKALEPLFEILPKHGIAREEISFAWSFTTQGPTRDLEALRAGLYGHGVFSRLEEEFLPDLQLIKASSAGNNLYLIPIAKVQQMLAIFGDYIDIGIIELTEEGKEAVLDSFNYIDYLVVGEVTGPNLLADRDSQAMPHFPGEDNEIWDLDRTSGRAYYKPHKIPFLCAIPRGDRGKGAPFPVSVYAHGYASTRLEIIAFAGNLSRHGIAMCSIDAPTHGLDLGDLGGVIKLAFEGFDMGPLFDSVHPSRATDVDNDGRTETGADFFSADLFRSRDNLRQTVLDIMVFIRALRALDGKTYGPLDYDADGQMELAGDFNGDGKSDIGGSTVDYYTWGTSLGGIISSVVAGIEPAIVAATPQACGGGLIDIARRSNEYHIAHSAIQRIMGPIFVGEPSGKPGKVDIFSLATSGNSHERLKIFSEASVNSGDRIEIENLVNGDKHVLFASHDGGFRTQVSADAMTATQKRVAFSFNPMESKTEPYVLSDTTMAGDAVVLRIYDSKETEPKTVINRFGNDVTFEGVLYPKGQPLVALSWGFGLPRNSPDFRRLLMLSQMIIDPADPINYAPRYSKDPLPADYDTAVPGTNAVLIATAGDPIVPVATTIALARASGVVDFESINPRFGKTSNQVLIDNYIVEGLARLKRFNDQETVMDPEDISRGQYLPEVPRLKPPLHLQINTPTGLQAIRIPMLNPKGQHGFLIPTPEIDFDNNTFMIHMVARFFTSGGTELVDYLCMEDASCSWMPK
ncbi:MAG: hypothetical protein V1754_11550 [Pseudomonadota bacterium]